MCGCSCGAGSEEGLNCAEGEGKSSQIVLCSTWQEVGKRSCSTHLQDMGFMGYRRDVQKERMIEMFDFQSLYVSLMFLCFLQKQKAGVRIGTYFSCCSFSFLILVPLT